MRPALGSRSVCTHSKDCLILLSAYRSVPLNSLRQCRSVGQLTRVHGRKQKKPILYRTGTGKCNASSSTSLQESTDANTSKEKDLPGGVKEGKPHSAGCLLLLHSLGVLRIAQLHLHSGYWMWRGHRIRYHRCGDCGPPVVLVHGFGGNW